MKNTNGGIKRTIKKRIELSKRVRETKMGARDELRRGGTPPRRQPVGLLSRDEIRRGIPNTNINNININIDACPEKTYIFNQYAGIGDILFIEPIIRKYFQSGHPVVLPVLKQFLNLQQNFPYIKFVDKELIDINYNERNIVENEDTIIIPIRFSPSMVSKYKMVNMDSNMWRTLTWLRHRYKEENLKKILGIGEDDKFNLINENFTSTPPFLKKGITLKNENKNIKMRVIEGYNLLDWSGVIESATTIHTVNTSIMYLLEILELSTTDIHVYSRKVKNGDDFRKITPLFTFKYEKHI